MCHTFKDEAEKLNQNNYSFTNETLYRLCQENPEILNADPAVLAGKIEMIGRVYAASPERRSYTWIAEHEEKPKNIIRNYGDGQGGFFDKLAALLPHCHENNLFQESYNVLTTGHFNLDFSDNDKELLRHSILLVLYFNKMIKDATIQADKASDYIINGKAKIKNQISFCSKFLHFHLPHHVFIIDSYSAMGSKHLFFTQNKSFSLGALSVNGWDLFSAAYDFKYANNGSSDCQTVLDCIKHSLLSQRIATVQKKINISQSDSQDEYIGNAEKDVSSEGYIQHAIRAYLLCCLCKRFEIEPAAQIRSCASPYIRSYPRLADCILMNIQ